MACAADALSSRSFVNLCSRDLKACTAVGTCALRLLLLSDTATLPHASVVESDFQLLTFVLDLAVTAARKKLLSLWCNIISFTSNNPELNFTFCVDV
jgi:hypothetical protein